MTVNTSEARAELKMPLVFRVMRKDANDNLPVVAQNSLGVRQGTDVDLDL